MSFKIACGTARGHAADERRMNAPDILRPYSAFNQNTLADSAERKTSMNLTALITSALAALFQSASPAALAAASYEEPAIAAASADASLITADTAILAAVQDEAAEPLPEPERVQPGESFADEGDGPDVPQVLETATGRSAEQEIARAGQFFESLTIMSARFRQVGPDGRVAEGDFALSRPGRLRFDYDDPSPILMVADGATVAIADSDLETVDRAPIRSTPLRWLLSSSDELTGSGAITEVGRYDGALYVTAEDPDGEAEGRVTLVIADPDPEAPPADMRLEGWYAIDGYGQVTQVTLSHIRTDGRLDPRLFVLDDDMFGSFRRGRR
jgi:outer membrane lipoprotein-sorting protein